jgi:hypothetical protein
MKGIAGGPGREYRQSRHYSSVRLRPSKSDIAHAFAPSFGKPRWFHRLRIGARIAPGRWATESR